jgi:hypothetical protein
LNYILIPDHRGDTFITTSDTIPIQDQIDANSTDISAIFEDLGSYTSIDDITVIAED